MSLRELRDMNRVLCPSLAGTYYFSVIGSHGYGYGILARSLQGFKHTAMRMATSEGFDKVLGLTARIRIVSLDGNALTRLGHERAKLHLRQVMDAAEWRLQRILEAKYVLPPGFKEIPPPGEDEDEKMTADGRPILHMGYGEEARYFAWTGTEDFGTRFEDLVAEQPAVDVVGAPSVADPPKPGEKIWFCQRGYDGGCGRQPWVGDLQEERDGYAHGIYGLFQETPAFFFVIEEELPNALDDVWAKLKEHRAAEKRIREAEYAEQRRKRTAEDRKELRALRDYFWKKAKK